MKRFVDTQMWQKEWYQDLSPVLKCLWNYLCANCDGAGVWEVNWRLATFQIGETVSPESLEAFGARVEILATGKVWIVGFIAFQNGRLSRDCKPHIPIIRALEKHGLSGRFPELSESPSKEYPKGIDTLEVKVKVKEEGKVNGQESEGGSWEAPPALPGHLAAGPTAEPLPPPDPDPELSVDEIVAGVQRIFDTKRRPGRDAMQGIADAMPVRRSELATLERFYALPGNPDDPRLARRTHPTNLAVALGDELVKSRNFFASKNGHGANSQPRAPAVVTPDQLRAFIASHPDHERFRPILDNPPATLEALPASLRDKFAVWLARQPKTS